MNTAKTGGTQQTSQREVGVMSDIFINGKPLTRCEIATVGTDSMSLFRQGQSDYSVL